MTKRIWICLLVAGLCLCLFPRASAFGYTYGEKTNTVDLYVGYFGTTYAYIGTVTEEEMQNNCYCGEWTYSSIDNGDYTRYNLAYGVTMDSLLSYLHIATSDIDEIYFLGTDNNYWAGFYNLFGVTHWYYPYLAQNWNQEHPSESNVTVINSLRYEVPAILAFQQSLYRDAGAFDEAKYRAMMDDEECLRIVFGQTTWNEVSTSDSVKWVYEIAVKLTGSPITASYIEMQIGSPQSVEGLYEVNTGFEELDNLIKSGIEITVDPADQDIVQVIDGQIYALQDGEAHINVTYTDEATKDEFSAPIVVSITGGEGYPGEPDDANPDDTNPGDTNPDDTNPEDTNPEDTNPDDTNPDDTNPNEPEQNPEEPKLTPDEPEGEGEGGQSGFGGEDSDGSNGSAEGSGSGSGTVTPGSGTGENTPSDEDGNSGGSGSSDAEGDDLGAGEAARVQGAMETGEESVPLSEEGEAVYEQVKGYMEEQLEDLEELPSSGQITTFTEELREYIEELIEQAEEEDEPLDMEEIIEMVEDYIDELVEEGAEEDAMETLSEEEPSEEDDSARAVYLSLGNMTGGDSGGGTVSTDGSMSTGGTAGGSGGQVLEIEPMPIYYTVILIVAIVAMFVGGGVYRSLRFRRETTER